jgi:hypothetical protein
MFDAAVDALADRGTLVVIGMMSAYAGGWKRSAHEGLAEKWVSGGEGGGEGRGGEGGRGRLEAHRARRVSAQVGFSWGWVLI